MKTPTILRASFFAASVLLALSSASAQAQVITDSNILRSTTFATASGVFNALAATDGTTTGLQFNTSDVAGVQEYLLLSGFNATEGIDTLKIFAGFPYYTRFAQSVTILSSSSVLTSYDPSNLGPFDISSTFALPTTTTPTSGLEGHYLNDSGSPDPVYGASFGNNVYYDTLTGLNIAAGTQTLVLLFDKGTNPVNDTPVVYDSVISEVQGFAAAPVETPEPSTWAMMLGGLALLGFVARRRLHV